MTDQNIAIALPLLLPEIEGQRDPCIEKLMSRVREHRGIQKAHLEQDNGQVHLCLHYNPHLISLAGVRRLTEAAGVEITRRYRHETLPVTGMDCADCASSLDHILGRMPGIITATASYAAETVRIEYDSSFVSHRQIVDRIHWMGYDVIETPQTSWIKGHWPLLLSILSGACLAAAFLGQTLLNWPAGLTATLYILAYLAGGYDAARHGFAAAVNLRFDVDFLMVMAALGAAALGNWAEGAFLLFLFSLGHALEHQALGRARQAVRGLQEIAPQSAQVLRDGKELEMRTGDLVRGDLVIVRPGERVPIDGQVSAGCSIVDQSPVTGESLPVEKSEGDSVLAGSLNGDGVLEIRVTRLARETTLARAARLVEEAQTQKSSTQLVMERFSRIFVPAVLGMVILTMVGPPLMGWLSWPEAAQRGLTLLVAASPCALAIAAPSAVLAGIARAARGGVLIKGGMHLENLAGVQAYAFDKTGTLTRGEPEVLEVIPFGDMRPNELLRLAAAVESRSKHPLAWAIRRKAEAEGLPLAPVKNLHSLPGRGVRAEVNGSRIEIGSPAYFQSGGKPLPIAIEGLVQDWMASGHTLVLLRAEGAYVGLLVIADRVRPIARESLERLKQLGAKTLVMLTGDNEPTANTIARQVGVTSLHANLLPDEKVQAVKQLQGQYRQVAMVGDGINDAPALAAATVGIAMGAGGSHLALETADIALMADDLSCLPFAVSLSQKTRQVIRQNLALALGVIALLLPAAFLGLADIGPAILLHESSTLLVVANSLRLLKHPHNQGMKNS